MRKANELRLGNLLGTDDGIIQVTHLVFNNQIISQPWPNPAEARQPGLSMEGIRLDDDWLERLGFERNGGIWENAHHKSPLIIQKEDKGYFMRQSNGYIGRVIEYVDQLQNLCR